MKLLWKQRKDLEKLEEVKNLTQLKMDLNKIRIKKICYSEIQ